MKDLFDTQPKLAEKIMSLMTEGNEFDESGQKNEALAAYQKAWELLPDFKLDWDLLTGWISGSLYNYYLDSSDFKLAKHWAEIALKGRSSEIDTGPIVSLGIACFELDEHEEAYRLFDEAYRYGKSRAFQERPKKYLTFYLDKKKSS